MKELLERKCFLLRGNLIISILKMATGKTLDELTEEDAKKLTLVIMVGDEENETVRFDGKQIGKIHCDFKEMQILYTFTPMMNNEPLVKECDATPAPSSNEAGSKNNP